MKRIVLFVATNVAVLAVIYLVLNILGVERIVTAEGTLDLGALLTFSAVVGFARSAGYRDLVLWTNDVLTSARHIYQRHGFTLVAEKPHHSFGKDLVGQDWRLDLGTTPE